MTTPPTQRPSALHDTLRVAIIGVGPRGLSVLERLVALHREQVSAAEANPVDTTVFPVDALEVGADAPAGQAGRAGYAEPAGRAEPAGQTEPAGHPTPTAQPWLASQTGPQLRKLDIHLIDPYPPGPGAVWRTDQSAELLMNTTIGEQTIFPDESCSCPPLGTGEDMASWYRARGGTEDVDSTFATRVSYGEYLADAYHHICAQAPESVTITHHATSAQSVLDPVEPGATAATTQFVRLADGTTVVCDAVVLAVGHVPAQLGDERGRWQEFAARTTTSFIPPGLPADTPVDEIGAHEPVVFRGIGLNYFDLQARLTTGRGGTFSSPSDASSTGDASSPAEARTVTPRGTSSNSSLLNLQYTPSGEEPLFYLGSRRGIPYRAKPVTPDHPLTLYPLRYFTAENIAALEDHHAHSGLRFNAQLWPLVLAELRHAWYAALLRSKPAAFVGNSGQLKEALVEGVARHLARRTVIESEPRRTPNNSTTTSAIHSAGPTLPRATTSATPSAPTPARRGRQTAESTSWAELEASIVPDPANRLNLHTLLHPLEGQHFESREPGAPNSLHDWMINHLEHDLAAALAGPENSPEKALFAVLWAVRLELKELIADGRIDPGSFVNEVRGWFEGFVAGMCDGPPPQRIAELLALSRQGLVRFTGPEVRIQTSAEVASAPGAAEAFIASSPAVPGTLSARVLVDASSPANVVRQAADTLISGMLDRRQLDVGRVQLADGTEHITTGLAVTDSPYRTLDATGRVHPHRYCLSLQLSAVQWGLAIAANPHAHARTLHDSHQVAQAILSSAG